MSGKPLRIVFMGTPDFAVPALDVLHTSEHEVVCVYTQPPRPKGRGQQVQLSSVHAYAQDHGIDVRTPRSLKKEPVQTEFMALNADVAVVAAYGLILPKAILDAPRYGCLNIHASLLPRWRGASPIQHAIWAGDAQTGIAIMQMDVGLDTGPVIAQRAAAIRPQTTAEGLHDELSALGAAMIEETVNRLARDGGLEAVPQSEEGMTYASMLSKEDGRVNWAQNARAIDRKIRALNPWPGVWSDVDSRRMKILEALPTPDVRADAAPGTILSRAGDVACGEGTALRLVKIQPAGKSAMDFSSAVNGGYLKPGGTFS